MDILTQIVETTREIIGERAASVSLETVKSLAADDARATISLKARLSEKPNIIAEFKRKSPSRPNINLNADPVSVAQHYEAGGAAAMSVLTEPAYFGGSPDDLKAIRRAGVTMPLLRKDFMVDPYQFHEARVMGADLVLLIARILEPSQIKEFTGLAHELGLEVLCEIHNQEELEKVGDAPVDFLGVNCRDLKKFQTNLDHLVDLAQILPEGTPWVAESGMHGPDDVKRLKNAGYPLFLIGEYLMKSGDPEGALRELINL